MANLIDKAKDHLMNRRSFLGLTAKVTAGAAAAVALPGCGLQKVDGDVARNLEEKDGKWITAACWHNCGGRCLNKALVVDGVVVRQKTDDTHPDSPEYPQQRACQRGHSQRKQCFGADRLKYPMKRKNWQPGGGKKDLRGKDEWVRISWEEALDIVASETKRVKEQHGNKAILSPTGNGALNLSAPAIGRALSAYGGYTAIWGTTSWGALPLPCSLMQEGIGGVHDKMSVRQSKLIVLWGANPAWSSGGNPTYNYLQAKKAGAKIITVDPFYNPSASVLADEWIPVRPGTDAALLIGMAYHMITNKLHDQAFLDQYVMGFDAEHMPAGADTKASFKDYVLGTYDKTPKTPEWASKICGTPVELIKSFAEEVCNTKPAAFITAYAAARSNRGEQFIQAFLTVGWMTGNVGKPGSMVGVSCKERAGDTGPLEPGLVIAGDAGVPPIDNPICNYGFPGPPAEATDWHGFVWDEAWDAVVTGQFTAGVRGKQPCDIRMIFNVGDMSALNQLPNINRGIEAFRKVDFVVTSASFLTTTAKYSDVVLPVTTHWERLGGISCGNSGHGGNREIFIYYQQITDPLYEAKDDFWIERELAKRWGLNPDIIDPVPLNQQVYNQLAGAKVIKENGSDYETLLTITEEDIKRMGAKGKPQTGRISLKELEEKGIYQLKRTPNDKLGYIAYEKFVKDPVANPLKTETGKLQIFSQKLSDSVTNYGWTKLPPIPQYHPPVEGVEGTLDGKFPFQLYSIHYARRSHSSLDNIPWLREAFPQEVFMNPADAAARSIKQGETIKVSSRHGVAIRPVHLTERMMPGVVTLGEGAWVEIDELTGMDKAGATNILTGTNPGGQGVQSWNTVNVQIEKYDTPLEPDYKWPQRIVL